MYYIEGTIDAIEFNDNMVHFSVSPSSAFLVEIDGDKKMALFIEDKCEIKACDNVGKNPQEEQKSCEAKLVNPTKNKAGKEALWFHLSSIHSCNSSILFDAKNNRSTIRVRTNIPKEKEFTMMAAHSLRIM